MSSNDRQAQFAKEMKDRFDAFVSWAVVNAPLNGVPLSENDLVSVKKEVVALADRGLSDGQRDSTEADPSEGGAQYVNVNPAPWP